MVEMGDTEKTREQLILELAESRQRITELETAEVERVAEELRKRDEQLEEKIHLQDRAQKYFEVAGVIFVVLDINGTIIQINKAGCEILGYEQGELLGENWFDTCLPDGGRQVMIDGHLVGELELDEYLENSVLTKSGEERTIVWNNAWLRDAAGNVIQSLSSGMDITERRQAEEALRASEHRFRMVIEDQTELICRFLPDSTYTFVNEVFCRFFGLSEAEIIGRRWLPNVHPDDVERVNHELSLMSPSNPVILIENRVFSGTGELRWMQFVNRGFYDADGNLLETQSVVRDVNERKRAEEQLQKSHKRFATVLDSSDSVVYVADMETYEVLFANEYTRNMFGEVVGKVCWQALQNGQSGPCDFCTNDKLVTADGELAGVYSWEFQNTVTGHCYMIHDRAINWVDGRVVRMEIATDTTELKQAEKEHVQLILERERIKILADFITQAAHEFRTPLSIINMSTYLLGRVDEPDKKKPYVDRIEEQVKNIAMLVDMLNLMAKLDGGGYDIMHEETDLNDILRAVCDPAQEVFQEKKLNVVLELSKSPLLLQADYEYLGQAIEHIMNNAVCFTPDNGNITVSSERIDGKVVIEIVDSGTGISEDVLPHIFERFYRADTSGKTRGFGLGLPIAKAIIELHRGKIEVSSVVGMGSTFRILLPLE